MKKIIDMLKSMTNSKKKVFALALATCVIVLSIASSSIAYFTDTAKFTNTFTSGNVKIQLSEAEIQRDDVTGNVVAKNATTNRIVATSTADGQQEYGSIFPKQTIFKDPTITNTGKDAAYVGAVVTITSADVDSVLSNEDLVKKFVTGLPTSEASVKVDIDTTNNTITIYVVFTEALAANKDAVVFTGLKMDDNWDNDDMTKLNNLQIVVKAYAVQSAGMTEGAVKALQTAFNTESLIVFPDMT
ncbi:MAG: hypothetical protein IJW53_03410 [Clostridia bacterium]|nr:hypothetical protein [Clostridia bacterium]